MSVRTTGSPTLSSGAHPPRRCERIPAAGDRSDPFAKNILRDALSRACAPETEVEVLAAMQQLDVYSVPGPARADDGPARPQATAARGAGRPGALPGDAWGKTLATPLLAHFRLRNEHATNQEDGNSRMVRGLREEAAHRRPRDAGGCHRPHRGG